MASNNDGGGGGFLIFLILLGLFGYVAYLLFLLAVVVAMTVYAAILYASLILSVLAVFAAFDGIRFFNLSVSPLHARLFLLRGLVGAVVAPSFVWFASSYYGLHVQSWLWPHIAFGGYALLSTGVFFVGSDGGAEIVEDILGIGHEDHYAQLAPPRLALPDHHGGEAKPRKSGSSFASWDDEEELRGR